MALLDFVFGSPSLDADGLAKPYPKESEDLSLHVQRCAERYGSLRRGLITMERWLIVLFVTLVATNTLDLKAITSKLLGL